MAMTFNPQTGQWEDLQFNSVTDSYEEPIGPAMPSVPALEQLPPAPTQQISPIVAEYLQNKQRGPASMPEAAPMPKMQSAPKMPSPELPMPSMQQPEPQSGLAGAQFASSIGDALAGRSNAGTQAAFQNMRAQAKEGELNDPNSPKSISFRKLVESTMPNIAKSYGKNWDKVTAADSDNILNYGKMRENIDSRRENMRILMGQKQDALGAKQAEKLDKKKQAMNEIEDRRQNINANLSTLKSMISDNGTWELMGSHNQDMDRLTEQIATDMAKLMDPSSVARPQEVEAIKRTLVKPGFSNKNSTAESVLSNFEKEINTRADSAYKIRGLEAPTGRPQAIEGAQPTGTDPKIESFMQKNGISDRNEAIRILKQHGKI